MSHSSFIAFILCYLQAVESEKCASFKAAMDAGQPVRIQADQSQTLADGIVQFKESVRGGAHFY